MSEVQPKRHESGQDNYIDSAEVKKRQEQVGEKLTRDAEHAKRNQDTLEDIQDRLEKATKNTEKPVVHAHKDSEPATPFLHKNVRVHEYKQRLRSVQKKLSPPERTFSKFIHQPAVEAVSEASATTIARPSGLLTGAIFSLVSSLAILYVCRHYGYEYNFLIGLVFFVGGFVLGLVFELAMRLIRR